MEQSSYDLLNLGDRAMLEAGVRHLADMWPEADIRVLTSDQATLARVCPMATPVNPFMDDSRFTNGARLVRGLGIYRKRFLPDTIGRRVPTGTGPLRLVREIESADIVVSTGGGFLNDLFSLHAAGVLSLISAAQRLGRPTAMFGQGIGPLERRGGIRQAARVLPKLAILGLRSPELGPIARQLRASGNWTVTGDDALGIAGAGHPPAEGSGIGLNIRARPYAGVGQGDLSELGTAVSDIRMKLSGEIVPLPIALSGSSSDSAAIESLVPGATNGSRVETTADLRSEISRCRIVITGSYHAAVFSLARGVPVIGLTRSPYYQGKFAGLQALFPPDAVRTVAIGDVDTRGSLSSAALAAWDTPDGDRLAIAEAAARMAASSTALWWSLADKTPYPIAARSIEGAPSPG